MMTLVYGRKKPVNVTTAQPFPVGDAANMTGLSVKKIEELRDHGIVNRGGKDEEHKVVVAKWKEKVGGKDKMLHGLPLTDQSGMAESGIAQ